MTVFIQILDMDPDDISRDEAVEIADLVYDHLREKGHDPEGVSTVLNPDAHKRLSEAE